MTRGSRSPHELGRLIQDRMDVLGLNYDSLAEAAGLPKGTVHAIVTRKIKFPPKIETLSRIAEGLQWPVENLSDAARRTTGYSKEQIETTDPTVRVIVHVAEQLSEQDRSALAAMAEAFLREAKKRKESK